MAQTRYQKTPNSRLTSAKTYKISPLTPIVITGQGTISKPVPPARPKFGRALKPSPVSVPAPGAAGTI
jgi:hypothetical protein